MKSKKIDFFKDKYTADKLLLMLDALRWLSIRSAGEQYKELDDIIHDQFCSVCGCHICDCNCDPEEYDPEYEADRADRLYDEWKDRQAEESFNEQD